MDTQQIIKDIELVRDILIADASPARRAAAAVLLRAAADAIEAQSEPEPEPALRPLKRGEVIKKGDLFKSPDGTLKPSESIFEAYTPTSRNSDLDVMTHYPHFRPINH